jgi:hypothetical protein
MIESLWKLINYTINTIGGEGIPVIWSYQNAARVKKPYITLNYSQDDLPDHDWYSNEINLAGIRVMASYRKAVVDLQVYASQDSMRIVNKLAMLLSTDKSLDKQMELDVAIGNRLFLARVPALLNESQYEDRAVYHFDFTYTESMKEDVGFIATVEIEGTYEGSLTETKCYEVISIPYPDPGPVWIDPTMWDDTTTDWDDNVTEWDML